MRIDIENHGMDITHFLYTAEIPDGTCKDCSDTFSLSDTKYPLNDRQSPQRALRRSANKIFWISSSILMQRI